MVQDTRFLEAISLAEDIIRSVEKETAQLDLICLKTSRLALLVNDPSESEAFTRLADDAGEYAAHLDAVEARFDTVLQDEPLNPFHSYSFIAKTAALAEFESSISRQKREIRKLQESKYCLSKIRTQAYRYALNIYYKLRFSDIPAHAFVRTRLVVDKKLVDVLPDSKEKFYSVYSNLESNNPEDWANAVHSCRRILQALADRLYPPHEGGVVESGGKQIKIGPNEYKNRIMLFVESKSTSSRFNDIVGSHLSYLGERLDAVYSAANKGTHTEITTREEAERYIVFTYLLIGDILSL